MKKALSFITVLYSVVAYSQTEVADTTFVHDLNEVVVKGEKPQITGENGVIVVNLPGIVKDKPVTNILEALSFLPGVIENDGIISLTGVSDVTIIINGEPTNIPLPNLYQLLYNTPVERLKNVEIMYSAPAKYHADGAVINVVMKTPTPLDGLQGQVRAGYNLNRYGSYGGGVAATYAVRDWTFDLNYGLSRSKSWTHEDTWSNHLYNGVRTMIEDNMRSIARSLHHNMFASVSWKNLKLTYTGQIATGLKRLRLSTGTLGNFTNISEMFSPDGYHNIALRYTSPFGMTVGGDYSCYSENRSQSLFKGDDYLLGSDDRQQITGWHTYIDLRHQIGKWQLDYGAEYNHSKDHSSQYYATHNNPDFDDIIKEDVANIYIGTQHSFDWGLSFNGSAKGEYYHNKYQHNWNFIPQFGATYYTNPNSIFQLNLSADRIYPSYWELHGGISHTNEYSTVIGNPKLQPYMQYDAQLNYILRQKNIATLYFQYGDKATVQLPYQSPDALNLIYQTINMNYESIVGLNLYVPIAVGYIWNANVTTNIMNRRAKAEKFHDISFDNRKWVFFGSISNSFKLSQNGPVSLSLDFSYFSPSLQGIADMLGLWRVDAGVKWQFGKKRCCELDLKADDIFNKWTPVLTITEAGQDYRMKVRDMAQNLKVTFIWRFNGFKPKESNPDTSRFGTGG